jgi:hypothetical protein
VSPLTGLGSEHFRLRVELPMQSRGAARAAQED